MQRVFVLDWLRVLAFGLLIFYHLGMLYTEGWGWHFKSQYQSSFLANLMLWSNQWRMSLLFFISGAALSLSFKETSRSNFLTSRIPKLLLPLLIGMLVIVVPQVYVEANSTGVIICPDFFHFWFIYLDQTSLEFADHKTIGRMHLTWNHLWFLPYILTYSILFWGFCYLGEVFGLSRFTSLLKAKVSLPMLIVLPIVSFYAIGLLLAKNHPVTHNFVNDWFNHARSFLCFGIGFLVVEPTRCWRELANYRYRLLLTACITFAYCLAKFHGLINYGGFVADEINRLLWSANLWLWLLCVIAMAQHFFRSSNSTIQYLNKGVFCFYIFHQTLIILVAYWLTPFALGPVAEPIIVISIVVVGCLFFYEILRRFPYVGIFFGISYTTQKKALR